MKINKSIIIILPIILAVVIFVGKKDLARAETAFETCIIAGGEYDDCKTYPGAPVMDTCVTGAGGLCKTECGENEAEDVGEDCPNSMKCCVADTDALPTGSACDQNSDCTSGYCNLSNPELPSGICQTSAVGTPDTTKSTGTPDTTKSNLSGNGIDIPKNTGLPDPQGGIAQILRNLLRWLLGIVGVVALIGFVISGIQYIISTGDQDMMERAKRNMLYSILGVIVTLAGFVIIQAIQFALEAKPF